MMLTGISGLASEPFLSPTPEDRGVAALEPDDVEPGRRLLGEDLVDPLLRGERSARHLSDLDQLGPLAGLVEKRERDEPVVDDDIGALQRQAPRR